MPRTARRGEQEARQNAWEWMMEYNEERLHDSLGDLTPLEFRRKYEA